ncbi:HNH endonuclease [Methyloceanibacter caenitepidi]|uniref:HNH nuclease domain-containing protein n=1 Tax=Methyloceanibacter caenitepidi TaxID=1384459 RepID=A0A0A8K6H2_9HYPH|nr:HNH endonuclease signature motif containing protein [Methyloceanibacter caenitepidi]BAQ18356.1 hypothetical protein GL4_2923 [Methyloceanibacter caenitepidi]
MTPYDLIAPRKTLTRKQKADIFVREDGICHICGERIDAVKEPWHADHVIPRAISGKDTLEEYKPAHLDCHGEKTSQDRKDIAKCDRIRADRLGVPKTRKGRPLPGTKASGWKKRMDGSVERRD